MERVCFYLRLFPGTEAEYDRRHAAIWPELAEAIRRVHEGDAVFSPRLAGFVLDAFAASGDAPPVDPELAVLSTREREVLALVADGARNKEIAETLVISEFTVKRHVQNILRKLELPSRRAAAAFYRAAFASDDTLFSAGRTA